MSGPSLYVYAIAAEPIRLDDLIGIHRERLTLVSTAACHAIVGQLTTSPSPDADTLRAQDALVRRLASRTDALLPARFGSRFDDDAAVRRTLDELMPRLEQALARVRGCEQMTIRLFHDATATATATDTATATTTAPANETEPARGPGPRGPGTQYMRQRAAEARHATAGIDLVRAHLAAHVTDERIEQGRLPMIGSIHHLIPRGTADAYRARLDERGGAADELGARGIRLRISGPSPAYAFAEATLS